LRKRVLDVDADEDGDVDEDGDEDEDVQGV
jgi:hypothetical protein